MRYLLVIVLLWTACQAPVEEAVSMRTELYFGRNIPTGGTVSDAQWQQFLNDYVTPAFPDGLTVLDASGQWKDTQSGQIIQEKSNVLILIHDHTTTQDSLIETLRNHYKRLFEQQSVMRVDQKVKVNF